MEPAFHTLPPLKRFKHQQNEETPKSSPLPAKKRKESRDSPPSHLPFNPTTTTNLPAKKRVWALEPLFNSPEKPTFSFDLNLEYQQSPDKQPPTPTFCVGQKLDFFNSNHINSDSPTKVADQAIKETEEIQEDGICCGVCQSTDGDPTDPIVFCDGCDLMVHATCYGNPLAQGIPEGDWFCSSCLVKKRGSSSSSSCSPSCCLCPVKGGVMKSTTDGKWAHILCVLLVPEVFFKNPEGREEIDCSQVPQKRWKELCYICKSTNGCALECSELKCSLAFHVGCGLNEDLCIEYKEGRHGKGGDVIAGFCKTHSEIWTKQQHTGKFKIVAREKHEK